MAGCKMHFISLCVPCVTKQNHNRRQCLASSLSIHFISLCVPFVTKQNHNRRQCLAASQSREPEWTSHHEGQHSDYISQAVSMQHDWAQLTLGGAARDTTLTAWVHKRLMAVEVIPPLGHGTHRFLQAYGHNGENNIQRAHVGLAGRFIGWKGRGTGVEEGGRRRYCCWNVPWTSTGQVQNNCGLLSHLNASTTTTTTTKRRRKKGLGMNLHSL